MFSECQKQIVMISYDDDFKITRYKRFVNLTRTLQYNL